MISRLNAVMRWLNDNNSAVDQLLKGLGFTSSTADLLQGLSGPILFKLAGLWNTIETASLSDPVQLKQLIEKIGYTGPFDVDALSAVLTSVDHGSHTVGQLLSSFDPKMLGDYLVKLTHGDLPQPSQPVATNVVEAEGVTNCLGCNRPIVVGHDCPFC